MCGRVAVYGAWCAKHRPERKRKPKQADPFYLSRAWRRFRAWYLANHPFCELCLKKGQLVTAKMVDHVIELKDGGAQLAEENVQALCWSCHANKTAREADRRKSSGTFGHNRAGEPKSELISRG